MDAYHGALPPAAQRTVVTFVADDEECFLRLLRATVDTDDSLPVFDPSERRRRDSVSAKRRAEDWVDVPSAKVAKVMPADAVVDDAAPAHMAVDAAAMLPFAAMPPVTHSASVVHDGGGDGGCDGDSLMCETVEVEGSVGVAPAAVFPPAMQVFDTYAGAVPPNTARLPVSRLDERVDETTVDRSNSSTPQSTPQLTPRVYQSSTGPHMHMQTGAQRTLFSAPRVGAPVSSPAPTLTPARSPLARVSASARHSAPRSLRSLEELNLLAGVRLVAHVGTQQLRDVVIFGAEQCNSTSSSKLLFAYKFEGCVWVARASVFHAVVNNLCPISTTGWAKAYRANALPIGDVINMGGVDGIDLKAVKLVIEAERVLVNEWAAGCTVFRKPCKFDTTTKQLTDELRNRLIGATLTDRMCAFMRTLPQP